MIIIFHTLAPIELATKFFAWAIIQIYSICIQINLKIIEINIRIGTVNYLVHFFARGELIFTS